jgi:hypothetical protein
MPHEPEDIPVAVEPRSSVTQTQAAVASLMEAVGNAKTEKQVKQILHVALGEQPPKPGRGRPRKWKDDAERKRAERAKANQDLATLLRYFKLDLESPIPPGLKTKYQITVGTYRQLLGLDGVEAKVLKEIARELKLIGKIIPIKSPKSVEELTREQEIDDATNGRGAGMLITDAPGGKGRVLTGSFGSTKADMARGLREARRQRLSKPFDAPEPGELIGVPTSTMGSEVFQAEDRRRGYDTQGQGPDTSDDNGERPEHYDGKRR